jgi:hypothetical protein
MHGAATSSCSRLWQCVLLGAACATKSFVPYATDTPPLALVPTSQTGVTDEQGRFREIYCTVLKARGSAVPDYLPCAEELTRVGNERPGTGKPSISVRPGSASSRWSCMASAFRDTNLFGTSMSFRTGGHSITSVSAFRTPVNSHRSTANSTAG